MQSTAAYRQLVAPSGPRVSRAAARLRPDGSTPSAVARLSVDEWDRDMPGIAIPRPEVHLVARFGPSARRGLDAHAFGARQLVHRKLLHGGQRSVSARLHLGTSEAVLGVSASAIAGRVVGLEDLWEAAAVQRLYDRLASAGDTVAAAAVLETALAERFASAAGQSPRVQLALDAADRLTSAKVSTVATDLGVSERHLRRVFRETLGVSPKEFAKLERFHRALRAARQGGRASWAHIAAEAGYYDQAHLIAEFRAISGVTPRALLGELRAAVSVG
jgi:AraC-like DNA-binding protein